MKCPQPPQAQLSDCCPHLVTQLWKVPETVGYGASLKVELLKNLPHPWSTPPIPVSLYLYLCHEDKNLLLNALEPLCIMLLIKGMWPRNHGLNSSEP